MQFIRHLNNQELAEVLLESDERELQQALRALPEWLRSATDRPEWFWQGQRATIHRRIAAAPRAWLRPVLSLATAMALLILAALMLGGNPAPKQAQVRPDPDQELLIAVEQAVESEVPTALEPAALLANEINHGAATNTHPANHKENRNEN